MDSSIVALKGAVLYAPRFTGGQSETLTECVSRADIALASHSQPSKQLSSRLDLIMFPFLNHFWILPSFMPSSYLKSFRVGFKFFYFILLEYS